MSAARNDLTGTPQVTVVVPVWDRYSAFLPECLDSVLRQEGERPRVLVVDNASNEKMPSLSPHVEVIRSRSRLTVGGARNLALREIDTETVLFLDADDRLLAGALAFLRSRMAACSGIVGCVGRYVSWNSETGETALLDRAPRQIVYRVAPHRRLFALANLRYNCFSIAGSILRTDAVRDANGFGDSNVGEDWILAAQLAFRGRFEFHRRPVFLRRVHEGSLWHQRHQRSEYYGRCQLLRARVRDDQAIPVWVRASMPLLGLLHRYDVARTALRGTFEPQNPLLQRKEATR